MPLTDLKLRNLKAGSKAYKVADAGGLHVAVSTAGTRSFRWKYRYGGKEKLLTLGRYTELGLAGARILRDEARAILKAGRDPSQVRKAERRANEDASAFTFEWYATRYWAVRDESWSQTYADRMWRRLVADVFPSIGRLPISEIEPLDVLDALRNIEARGAINMAHKVRFLCGQVFRFAISEGRLSRDPTQDLRGALKHKPRRKHMSKVPSDELPKLLDATWSYDGDRLTRQAPR